MWCFLSHTHSVSPPLSSPPPSLSVSLSLFSQAGNIAELLLQEGFAWCVDWSMSMVTNDKDKLRAAEK